MVLPDLERQRSIEELSRLVQGIHEEVQREAQRQATNAPATEVPDATPLDQQQEGTQGACGGGGGGGAAGAEGMEEDSGAC